MTLPITYSSVQYIVSKPVLSYIMGYITCPTSSEKSLPSLYANIHVLKSICVENGPETYGARIIIILDGKCWMSKLHVIGRVSF